MTSTLLRIHLLFTSVSFRYQLTLTLSSLRLRVGITSSSCRLHCSRSHRTHHATHDCLAMSLRSHFDDIDLTLDPTSNLFRFHSGCTSTSLRLGTWPDDTPTSLPAQLTIRRPLAKGATKLCGSSCIMYQMSSVPFLPSTEYPVDPQYSVRCL